MVVVVVNVVGGDGDDRVNGDDDRVGVVAKERRPRSMGVRLSESIMDCVMLYESNSLVMASNLERESFRRSSYCPMRCRL